LPVRLTRIDGQRFRERGEAELTALIRAVNRTCLGALLALALTSLVYANARTFTIEGQEASRALLEFGRQSSLQIIFASEKVKGVITNPVHGNYEPIQALKILLKGTSLVVSEKADGVLVVEPSKVKISSREVTPGKFSEGLVDREKAPAANPAGAESNLLSGDVSEIVVTAQKKSERLQDVPIPMTALSADTLVGQNQFRLQDYYTSVPGLSLATRFDGSPEITIRGISTGFNTNPTVGITVDDVPYGSSTNLGGADYLPDLDPSDLARVEVLRGPQGTLYGANSIGGLLKYVTVDPSTDEVSGLAQASTSGVYHGAEAGYSFRGSINVPLSDTLAIRASGFTRRDPGYIDNIQTSQKGVNNLDVYGGRVATLWRPSQEFSLKLSALVQDSSLDGAPYVQVAPGLAGLQQAVLPGAGIAHKRLEAYSATATAKLGNVDLVSVSGYNSNRATDVNDLSFAFGSPAAGTNNTKNYKFSQELRVSGFVGPRVEWLVGGFYTHEDTPYVQQILTTDPSGALLATLYNADFPTTYTEYAGFADLTLHFTDQFEVQIGGRESHIKETYSEVDTGPFAVPSPSINPEVAVSSNSFTYLVTPQFKFSQDFMVYARLASGYRPGGPNALCTLLGAPCQFGPDKTTNYDLGVKGNAFDHVLSFDASLYYISWRNIQLMLNAPGDIFQYISNAGTAKSQGIELSGEARPARGLTISAWIAWNQAELTQAFPASSIEAGGVYGADGDRLPYSSRISGDFTVRQEFSITDKLSAFAAGDLSYAGDRVGEFTTSALRARYPGYGQINLRTGARIDAWTVQLLVNNIADKRGLLYGGLGSANPAAYFFITPRTASVSISRAF
jgi:iron complex outermembrane recepter protein